MLRKGINNIKEICSHPKEKKNDMFRKEVEKQE